MGIFNNKKPQSNKQALERAQKSGTDRRVYGDLIYRCRRCGEEGRISNIPNIDKVAYALLNGTDVQAFMTANFYMDPDTNTIYRECMHHECEPGKYGYMEIVGADIKGQIYLADKYKKHEEKYNDYNPDDELSLDDIPEE